MEADLQPTLPWTFSSVRRDLLLSLDLEIWGLFIRAA